MRYPWIPAAFATELQQRAKSVCDPLCPLLAPRRAMRLADRFLAIAKDPTIIPGVHHHCDEWCDYCPVTTRCFGHRCTEEFRRYHRRRRGEPTFASIEQAAAFTREMSAAEGVATPELDLLLSQSAEDAGLHTGDPLAGIAFEYAIGVAALMATIAERVVMAPPQHPTPAAENIVLWYHLRIYFRLVRALVSKERSRSTTGAGGRLEDAIGSAKLVLVSAHRSRDALRTLVTRFDRAEINRLIGLLDDIERGIDDRLPEARRFARLGLDVPIC
jgi:hypothetical protein